MTSHSRSGVGDYAYSVVASGHPWDVYVCHGHGGAKGLIAFRMQEPPSAAAPDGRWVVGYIGRHIEAEDMIKALEKAEAAG